MAQAPKIPSDQERAQLRKQLDDQFRGPLMAFFLRRIRNRPEAEDLTQEVFVRLLGVADLERLERVDAFVFRIASNLLHDRGREAARGRIASQLPSDDRLIDELTQEFGDDLGPERVLIGKQTVSEVLKCLDQLGDVTRNIFVLFRLEGMKQREIATLYGISQSSVEKHVMKAMMHLSRRIE